MRKFTKLSVVLILVLILFSMNVLPVLAAVPTDGIRGLVYEKKA